jgi:hypothetical protein
MPMTTTSRFRPRSCAAGNLEADRSWSRITFAQQQFVLA